MAYTLATFKAFLRDRNVLDSSARAERDYVRIANGVSTLIRSARTWDFDKRFATQWVYAPYSTGTVTVTNGSATVTGAGTAFTAAMVGRFMWLASGAIPSSIPYEILTVAVLTQVVTLKEVFVGTSGSGVAYQVTNERVALPARFRCLEKPDRGDWLYRMQPCKDLRDLFQLRLASPSTGTPFCYGVEITSTAPYLWLYPVPGEAARLSLGYYEWGPTLATDLDDFGLPAVPAAQDCIEQYALAYLARQQGKMDEFQASMAFASQYATEICSSMRPITEDEPGRAPYRPGGTAQTAYITAAPGVVEA